MLDDNQLERFSKLFEEKIKPAIVNDIDAFNELAKKAEHILKKHHAQNEGGNNVDETVVELKCGCGSVMQGLISEEHNYKEDLICTCGKQYILLEITEGETKS